MKNFFTPVILCVLTTLTLPASALSTFTAFTTIEQAQLYCPNTSALTFTQTNPNVPNGPGTINGSYNNVTFASFSSSGSKQVLHPKNVRENGLISNVEFRDANGMFGYISGNAITCLYSYQGFTGVNVALIMRGMGN